MTQAIPKKNPSSITTNTLDALILEIKRGNSESFSTLYDMYSSALLGVAIGIVKDKDEAEDVLHIAFVKIWKSIHSYSKSKGTIFTWMLNITRNSAIDRFRKLNKQKTVSMDDHWSEISTSAQTPKINQIGLKELVDTLPTKYRIIIDNLFYKGFTQQETSDRLCLPLGTVKTRTRFALQSMRSKF